MKIHLTALIAVGVQLCLAQNLPHPCSLITQSDVETALGKGATMTRNHNPRTGFDECRLASPNTAVKTVVMVLHASDNFEMSKKQLMQGGTDAKSAPGLGEDAYVGRLVGYNVLKHHTWLQVFGAITNEDAANDKATRLLAEKAVARL